MSDETIKILTRDNKIIALKEFFEVEREGRKEQAKLPFEEKIRILVRLQKLAVEWGGKKEVMIWGT